MSTGEGETSLERTNGDRSGLPIDPVQRGEGDGPTETDWHYAFQVLSSVIGKQMVQSDLLVLVFRQVQHIAGDEAAESFAIHACLNRSKAVHKFMG